MKDVLAALSAETEALRHLVANLDSDGWDLPTPSAPWTIADQIGHLAYFDEKATLSATDPEAFAEAVNADAEALATDISVLHQRESGNRLAWWNEARTALIEAFADLDPDERLPWYGPPMRARSSVVARLMETWAHGVDVADALGSELPVTDRLFHIADLGIRTFSWAYRNRGMHVPDQRVRVALRGPSGSQRVWNDECDASITGPVEEFCFVVAQRRRVEDTHLVLEGGLARQWMGIAQIFAGPPGPGRERPTDL